MTDGILLSLGCGIFFIFLSGAYVYVRESASPDPGASRSRAAHNEVARAAKPAETTGK
jgi:hypothetical protein